jgi:nitronate monooxygenase
MDPENLPEADKSTMNFGSGGGSKAKAWKDIWGAGQGVGTVHDIPGIEELVLRMEQEYNDAKTRLG